jgi:hypothetical protein
LGCAVAKKILILPIKLSTTGFTNCRPKKSDMISVTREHLVALRGEINSALPGTTDKMTRYHLQDVVVRINQALDPK